MWDVSYCDFDSSVDLNFTEKVNEVTLSYISVISLELYTLKLCTYASVTAGREVSTEDLGSTIVPCLLFSFSSFSCLLFSFSSFSQYAFAGNWQYYKGNMNLQNQ